MIKMLQYKMYPAGELRCPTTALVLYPATMMTGCCCTICQFKSLSVLHEVCPVHPTFISDIVMSSYLQNSFKFCIQFIVSLEIVNELHQSLYDRVMGLLAPISVWGIVLDSGSFTI